MQICIGEVLQGYWLYYKWNSHEGRDFMYRSPVKAEFGLCITALSELHTKNRKEIIMGAWSNCSFDLSKIPLANRLTQQVLNAR